jgi:hypothetical protein
MSSTRTLLVLLGVAFARTAAASELKPTILVESRIDGTRYPSTSRRGPMMEKAMVEAIRKEFPCANVTTWGQLEDALSAARRCALAGLANCLSPAQAAPLCDVEYVVVADQSRLSDRTVVLRTDLRHVRKMRVLVSEASHASVNEDLAIDAAVKKFVDAVAEYELCPYRGTIRFSVRTNGTRKPEDASTPVYCNGSDQAHRRKSSDERSSEVTWTVRTNGERKWRTFEPGDREGKPLWRFARATAEVSGYRLEELTEETEEDPCHTCSSGRKAGLSTTQITHAAARLDPDPQSAVALVDLKFSPDGTYGLEVEAGTGAGGTVRHTARVERWAEGSCDAEPRKPPKKIEKTLTLPLRGHGFTAKGTPRDKRLQAEFDQKVPGPGDGEETTIHWEVDLRRD